MHSASGYQSFGNSTFQAAPGPAPIPGAGRYSWIVLLIGGMWINRKKIRRLAKGAAGGVGLRVGRR